MQCIICHSEDIVSKVVQQKSRLMTILCASPFKFCSASVVVNVITAAKLCAIWKKLSGNYKPAKYHLNKRVG